MRGAHSRHDVDVDTLGPARFVVAPPEPGCVVDQNVDAAKRLSCRRDVADTVVLVGKIAYACMRRDAVRQDLLPRRVECRLAPGADRNGGTGSRECKPNRPPDAAAAPGDDGALTLQADLHQFPLLKPPET